MEIANGRPPLPRYTSQARPNTAMTVRRARRATRPSETGVDTHSAFVPAADKAAATIPPAVVASPPIQVRTAATQAPMKPQMRNLLMIPVFIVNSNVER